MRFLIFIWCLLIKWGTVSGLVCDIIGAIFVASEVVIQYHGQKYDLGNIARAHSQGFPLSPKDIDTKKYKDWQTSKYKRMKIGLFSLVFGFTLQIIGSLPL